VDLLAPALGAVIGLGLAALLGQAWFESRPFTVGLGHSLIPHVADNAFPSDHASLFWSLGAAVIATRAAPAAGWAVVALGGAVGWARIYLGVHFPIDMVGAGGVALAAGLIARELAPAVQRRIAPAVNVLYERTLQRLHLPGALFPRHANPAA